MEKAGKDPAALEEVVNGVDKGEGVLPIKGDYRRYRFLFAIPSDSVSTGGQIPSEDYLATAQNLCHYHRILRDNLKKTIWAFHNLTANPAKPCYSRTTFIGY